VVTVKPVSVVTGD